MTREKLRNSEILGYLTAESLSIKKSIDRDCNGFHGWTGGVYFDGNGWIPNEDYVPT